MSLHDKTLLITLTLTGISSSRQDKEITRDVLSLHNAREDAGRWMSRLWPKEALEPIRSIDSQIRSFHYAKTLPWMDKGERIIASRTFTPYMEEMRELRFKRETLAQGFIDAYDYWLDQAREMRASAFRPEEYPTAGEARQRFKFELNAVPVPHRDDFRVTLASEDLAEVQASLDSRVEAAQLNATTDLYRRIAAPVAALVERLANPDARLTDATLNALRELTATLPDINVLDDPEVEMLRQTIKAQLCSLHPETLTASPSDRNRALSKANSILATMAPWLDGAEPEESEAAA